MGENPGSQLFTIKQSSKLKDSQLVGDKEIKLELENCEKPLVIKQNNCRVSNHNAWFVKRSFF